MHIRWTKPLTSNPTLTMFFSHYSRLLTLLLLLLAAAPVAQAQRGGRAGGDRLGQLDNARIAFITNRVSLTQEQAQKFWPLYNDFSNRRRELNRNDRLLRRGLNDGLSDQQIRDNMNQSFALRQQVLNLEKEYFEKFQKVISLRQVAQLQQAERDFTREVIKRVADRRGSPPTEDD